MNKKTLKIGVTAPSCPVDEQLSKAVGTLARKIYPEAELELVFHPQCFLSAGHFAGDDAARAAAFLEYANAPEIDAVWFARGGYGACRILDLIDGHLTDAARAKTYLGYSDLGGLLAALYQWGCRNAAHGPMPADLNRNAGEAAVTRALRFLVERDPATLEPTCTAGNKTAAFNIAVLSQIIGTPYQPDLTDHIVLLEEVGEYLYRIDRYLFHITSNPQFRKVAGLKLGRCSDIPENDRPFGQTEEQVIAHWCAKSGIPYLGRADIGHDADNKIVPFGAL